MMWNYGNNEKWIIYLNEKMYHWHHPNASVCMK